MFSPPGASIGLRERVSIRSPLTAKSLAEGFTKWTKPLLRADEAMGKGKAAKGAPKVIIEAFPGTLSDLHPLRRFACVLMHSYRRFSRSRSVDESLAYPSEG